MSTMYKIFDDVNAQFKTSNDEMRDMIADFAEKLVRDAANPEANCRTLLERMRQSADQMLAELEDTHAEA